MRITSHFNLHHSQAPYEMVIGAVVYTEVIVEVKVEGMKCQALLDMGAGSSRTSASLLKEE